MQVAVCYNPASEGGTKGGTGCKFRMARAFNVLTARTVEAVKTVGRLHDGGGLYLRVKASGARSWSFRWKRDGQLNEMAIGPYPAVSLAAARSKAAGFREMLANGGNPRVERKPANEPSFRESVEKFLEAKEGGWSNPKHRQQWRNTLATYCKPIWKRKVAEIELADVLSVLQPIWAKLPETASRLRGRIEKVLSYAQTHGWRSGANPAVWRGNLENVLSKPKKLVRGHHAAMAFADIPALMERLKRHEALAARALELLILTGCRSGEVLEARWREIDLEAGIWTLPAERMKARKEHRVPLSEAALAILRPLHEARMNDWVFPGQKPNRPLSGMAMEMLLRRMKVTDATVHGFRSSFRDWAGDCTSFPRELAEISLAHNVGNAVEQAYRRADALEKRRALMREWETYCMGGNAE